VKIALVGDYPPPFGGLSVHVRALERALRSRGVEVRVLDIGKGDHREPDRILPARGPVPFARELAAAAAWGFLLHVHTSGANPKSWLVALAASRARRPFAAHGVLTLHSGLSPSWLAASGDRRGFARAACAGYGRVVAVNAEIAEAVMRCGVPADRIAVVPAFSPSQVVVGPLPHEAGGFRRERAPLFSAALAQGPTYGEDLLDEAFAALREREPRAGLVVFGPGSTGGLLARRGLAGGVLALGEIPNEEALATMAAADVFVRPTRADGDAVSVREALTFGRPVVASAVGHRPPGCLLFPVGDARALAAQMLAATRLPRDPLPLVPGKDSVDALWSIYAALGRARPVGRGPAAHAQHASSRP
jgi:glycosyltransferase involved in cell wall biosynthesis